MTEESRYIQRPELAATLGVCIRTLKRMEKQGQIPKSFPVTPGGMKRAYIRAEVFRMIEQQKAS